MILVEVYNCLIMVIVASASHQVFPCGRLLLFDIETWDWEKDVSGSGDRYHALLHMAPSSSECLVVAARLRTPHPR